MPNESDLREQLLKMEQDRDRWRRCVVDVFNLTGLLTDDFDLIQIDRSPGGDEIPRGTWVAWHEQYTEDGCVPLIAENARRLNDPAPEPTDG